MELSDQQHLKVQVIYFINYTLKQRKEKTTGMQKELTGGKYPVVMKHGRRKQLDH